MARGLAVGAYSDERYRYSADVTGRGSAYPLVSADASEAALNEVVSLHTLIVISVNTLHSRQNKQHLIANSRSRIRVTRLTVS